MKDENIPYKQRAQNYTSREIADQGVMLTNKFQITYTLILLSLATSGMGSYLFGFFVFTNISTWFIYFALVFQIISNTLRIPKALILIYLYIVLQTFVFNFNVNSIASSFKQFVGLIVFSTSIFSFITVYKNRLVEIVKTYYKFVIFVSTIAILQVLLFIFFKISFVPQNFISGTTTALHSNTFRSEIIGIFPRAIGLSTEPSHFAVISLPGVYLSLLVLIGKGSEFGLTSKFKAIIIVLGLILSFSLVGYLGLILCLVFIFASQLRRHFIKITLISLPLVVLFLFSFRSPVGHKLTSMISMFKNIKGYEYTTNELSGWAMVSNIMVAKEGLKRSHYLGTGLNTHMFTYDSSIHKLFKSTQIIMILNRENAGSLFIRLTSEFGIPGIIGIIFFLIYYKLGSKTSPSAIKKINSMSLIVLITYCARNGTYLNIFLMLFLAIYYFSYKLEKE